MVTSQQRIHISGSVRGLFLSFWMYCNVPLPSFCYYSHVCLVLWTFLSFLSQIIPFQGYFGLLWIFCFHHFRSEITRSCSLSVLFSYLYAALCTIYVNMPRSSPPSICFHHSDESPLITHRISRLGFFSWAN